MSYTLKIYRFDRRCKSGERHVGSYNFNRPDDSSMDREINELRSLYSSKMFRMEYSSI